MPLRDDHDAALARADALQAELDRERAAHAEQSERIGELERELAAARARLERAEEALGDIKPRKPVDADRPPREPERMPDEARAKLGMMGAIGLLLAIAMGIALCARNRGDDPGAAKATDPVAVPQPPFVADVLVREGMARLTDDDLVVSDIHIDYIGADGTLDPTHGRITIKTVRRPPPKPPDDPNRPTGAPEPHASDRMVGMMMANCPQPYWSPRYGWDLQRGACLSFGEEPSHRPLCTPASIVGRARADGAPDGLARIHVDWTYSIDARGKVWRWSYSISDSARGIDFRQTYDDGNCPPPPVEK
jgi:hypothetical protein